MGNWRRLNNNCERCERLYDRYLINKVARNARVGRRGTESWKLQKHQYIATHFTNQSDIFQ